MRYSRIRPKIDITIEFKFNGKQRLVTINKGETLLLWRGWHHTTHEYISLLERNGFSHLNASLTNDRQFILTISQIDSNND